MRKNLIFSVIHFLFLNWTRNKKLNLYIQRVKQKSFMERKTDDFKAIFSSRRN